MNEFVQSIPNHRVDFVLVLLFFLTIFVILLLLSIVANPTDAHKSEQHHRKRNARFEAGVKALDQHHGAIEHRRSVIRPLYTEDDDGAN